MPHDIEVAPVELPMPVLIGIHLVGGGRAMVSPVLCGDVTQLKEGGL